MESAEEKLHIAMMKQKNKQSKKKQRNDIKLKLQRNVKQVVQGITIRQQVLMTLTGVVIRIVRLKDYIVYHLIAVEGLRRKVVLSNKVMTTKESII